MLNSKTDVQEMKFIYYLLAIVLLLTPQLVFFTCSIFPNILAPIELKSLFLTFQFWKYPTVITKRLVLDPCHPSDESLHILFQVDANGSITKGIQIVNYLLNTYYFSDNAGLVVKYFGQGSHFINYLLYKTMQIDVWDGESLMHLGI